MRRPSDWNQFWTPVFLGNGGVPPSSSKICWLFSPHAYSSPSLSAVVRHYSPTDHSGARAACGARASPPQPSALAPPRTVPGSSCLWAPAVALFSRELLLRRSLLPNPLPRAGSILGKISARGESREPISREDGRRLLFAGSGTATTGASAGAATGAGVQRHGPPSARPGRGCRETPAGAALSPAARSCP